MKVLAQISDRLAEVTLEVPSWAYGTQGHASTRSVRQARRAQLTVGRHQVRAPDGLRALLRWVDDR
jgi:hypothetical protein